MEQNDKVMIGSQEHGLEDKEERFYTLLRYKCKRCGFELERRYASPDADGGGMVSCTCGSFDFDPHPWWPRVCYRNGVNPREDLEEQFELAPAPRSEEEDLALALKLATQELIEEDAAVAAATDTSHTPTTERMQRMWEALKRAEEDVTGALLLPGYPEGCQGNGRDPRFGFCCDECDYLQLCMKVEAFYKPL